MYCPIEPLSVEEYKSALDLIKDQLSEVHLRMFQAQYEAPNHTVTASELANAVGYKSFSPANLHYGRLGCLIGEAANFSPPPRDNSTIRWWPILSAGIRRTPTRGFQWVMHPQLVQALEELGWVELKEEGLAEEITEVEPQMLREGSIREINVNAYERNPKARRKCIAHYGSKCVVCQFDFESRYGEIGKGFIHVHHEKPIATIGEEYEIDPIADLKPVCPNCHAIIHKRKPAFSIEEVRAILR